MTRNIAAGILGVIVALVLVQLIESFSHLVYPPPAEFEFDDPEQVRTFIASLPAGAVIMVGSAWALGAFCGTLIAALIATAKPLIYASIVGGIVLAGAITMLIIIPHPLWFTVSAPIAVLAGAFLGMHAAPRLRPARSSRE